MSFKTTFSTYFSASSVKVLLTLLCLVASGFVSAQDSSVKSASAPANPARDLVAGNCLQCHSDAIWRDQRQNAIAWEATLYRMLARGAVWTGEDIKTMANYLATDFGPNVPKVTTSNR